jgi:hypothetical protein
VPSEESDFVVDTSAFGEALEMRNYPDGHVLASEEVFNSLIAQMTFGDCSMVHRLQLQDGRTSL